MRIAFIYNYELVLSLIDVKLSTITILYYESKILTIGIVGKMLCS